MLANAKASWRSEDCLLYTDPVTIVGGKLRSLRREREARHPGTEPNSVRRQ